jgi:phosphate uptake regulator
MKRKLIKQKSAYTITLPIEWIRENNLEAKDEIEIIREKDSLLLSSKLKSKTSEITINLEKGIEDYYRIMIENPYLRGYDRITINLSDKSQNKIIQKIVSNLIGYEITNQANNFIEITQTAEPTEEQFKKLLERSINIIANTQEILKESFEKNSFKEKEEIKSQKDDARRFLLFCTRTLHKKRITNREDETFMHLFLERLILIEHNYSYLYERLSNIPKTAISKQSKEDLELTTEMFNLFRKIFFKKQASNFAKINELWKDIYFSDPKLKSKEDQIVDYHLRYLSKLIFLISQPNLTSY